MCPVCIATAALIAGKVTSASGAAAIAIKKLGGKPQTQTEGDEYANDDRNREDRVA
jgi:hypothetical protein